MDFIEFLERWHEEADEIQVDCDVFYANPEEDETFYARVVDFLVGSPTRFEEICSFPIKADKEIRKYLERVSGSIQSIKGVHSNPEMQPIALEHALELFYAYCKFEIEFHDSENSIEKMWNFEAFREFWEGHAGTLIPKIKKMKYKNHERPSMFAFHQEPPKRSQIHWEMTELQLIYLVKSLIEKGFLHSDTVPFRFKERELLIDSKIHWTETEVLLIYLFIELTKKEFLANDAEKPYVFIEKHFVNNKGMPFKRKQLSQSFNNYVASKTGKPKKNEIIDQIIESMKKQNH